MRQQQKLQRKYQPLVEQALKSQINKFIDRYQEVGQRAVNDLELWSEEMLNVYKKLYRETVLTFANLQYRLLQVETRKDTMGFNAKWTEEVDAWLSRYGLSLVSTVTNNQRERILDIMNKVIQDGVDQGLGIEEVTNAILLRLREFGRIGQKFNAERITRTETIRAANIGHMKGASEHNFEVLKVWISGHDNRTRRNPEDEFDHWILDGQKREMNEPFYQVGIKGRAASAQQPGDPEAPAAFTINCRCTIAFEGKRDANGRLIKKRI